MSAYAAAYAPPRPRGAGSAGAAGATGTPTSYAPPGAPRTPYVPGPSMSGPATGSGFSYSSGSSWPSAEQLVAAVPVRPFEFSKPAQKVTVGERGGVAELRGLVPKPFAVGEDAEFFLLKSALTDNEVAEILAAGSKILGELIGSGKAREPEPTDGRPRFCVDLVERGVYSSELAHVIKPLVENALLPYIRQKFACPGAALATARFRRFVPEERRFVPPHHEHGAFVAMTLGLQAAEACTGGLFVQGSGRAFLDRKFVPLGRGDVCVYRHDLHHGEEVQEGSRFELVLLFKDSQQAVADDTSPWHFKAAEAGDAASQYGCALSLIGQKDFAGARAWLDKASGQDQPEALYTLADWAWEPPAGSGFQADSARALQLWRRAAELGHGRSQSRLGGLLSQGVKGRVQQDSWEGKRLLRLAFEQDEPDAGFYLGQTLLQEGDRDGATKLLAACAKGHPRACFQVAEMYREAQYHFPKDIPQSLRYTKWAAHQGDPQALSNLGHLVINGMGVIRDDAKAVRLFRHAAKSGAPEGMLNYGLALLRGNGGVRVDYQEALEWAQKAAAQGHTLAHQQLPMFFNAAKNPNPPARSHPSSREELNILGVKDLRDLLRTEGIDFSDCVEKADLVVRAAMHLPGVAEPWDAAPEHTLLLEPPKKSRAELMKQRAQQTVSPATQGVAASGPSVSGTALGSSFDPAGLGVRSEPAAAAAPAVAAGAARSAAAAPPQPAPVVGAVGQAAPGGSPSVPAPAPAAQKKPPRDEEVIEYEFID
uniref:Fe2OG dioxygenase domain-containing protein n=1 Tax=Alexandrium andersonii TaxID=327968 RepID=A0A7S2HXR5_9DINO|mmetsp:Transcript_76313/g.170740  ORF Transcript_76313/g.170740 Transcript_76313/m.170740 type:complete len:765 (+) Transcript_76313:59-2353(+)